MNCIRCGKYYDNSTSYNRFAKSGIYISADLCDACFQQIQDIMSAYLKKEIAEILYRVKFEDSNAE